MKKLQLLLALSFLSGCGIQSLSPQFSQIQSRQTLQTFSKGKALTAKTAFPIALNEIKKLKLNAPLYEIDVWQEREGNSLQYGFLKTTSNESYATIRVTINPITHEVKTEEKTKWDRVPTPVNREHWKLDNQKIYALAQQNGLRDQEYLATLWEDTWHISGLKQHLYFQMDSLSGAIKLRCIGPYLDHCTGADGDPVTPTLNQKKQFRQHLVGKR